jgi:ABC-type sugar transport system ATPase subunit
VGRKRENRRRLARGIWQDLNRQKGGRNDGIQSACVALLGPLTMAKLRLAGIYKSFDSTQALKDVSFSIESGAVLALCGENGAGKSTLIKILSGAVQPDRGEILLNENRVHIETPRRAIGFGIHTVHQELSLLPHLSVAENLRLGRMPHKGPAWRIDWKATHAVAQAALADLGFENVDVEARTDSLAVSVQQIVEISKALIDNPKILILDEPTAVLSTRETDILFGKIRDLAKRGTTVIYISHRIEEIFDISDHVFVLKDGAGVLNAETKTLDRDALVRAMVGRSLAAIYPVRNSRVGKPVLECKSLGAGKTFRDISFEVRSGEIVGMFGLVGSGRTDLAKALFGGAPYTSGKIAIDGVEADVRTPHDAVSHGIALVTEDRKRDGLALELTAIDNGGLASMNSVSRSGVLDRRAQRQTVGAKLDNLAVRPRNYLRRARHFSGGNQQKIVLAKWLLMDNVRLFIFYEPTLGVDIATKVEIYSIIARLADSGRAILLISSEMPEVLGLSDRILIMRAGAIVAQLDRTEFAMETVFAYAAGVERSRVTA